MMYIVPNIKSVTVKVYRCTLYNVQSKAIALFLPFFALAWEVAGWFLAAPLGVASCVAFGVVACCCLEFESTIA